MSFCIDDEKLLEKYKAISTKSEDLENIELNSLPIYDDKYKKTKQRHMVINFKLTLLAEMCQKIIWNVNLLQSSLLILYLYTNIIWKYI